MCFVLLMCRIATKLGLIQNKYLNCKDDGVIYSLCGVYKLFGAPFSSITSPVTDLQGESILLWPHPMELCNHWAMYSAPPENGMCRVLYCPVLYLFHLETQISFTVWYPNIKSGKSSFMVPSWNVLPIAKHFIKHLMHDRWFPSTPLYANQPKC